MFSLRLTRTALWTLKQSPRPSRICSTQARVSFANPRVTMATNSGRGNPIAAGDGPKAESAPPPLSAETKAAVQQNAGSAEGMHSAGADKGAAPAANGPKVKTEKELEKERKKKEKQAKFDQKKAAQAAQGPEAPPSKGKEKKAAKAKTEDTIPEYKEETPPGEKKRLRPLEDPNFKAYNPVAVESAWYDWWETEGFFKPQLTKDGKIKEEGSYVIVHPPPNVTGALHMGHALGDSLQDLLIRWNRMHGKTTLWVPGADHAGISTQQVVENMLWRKEQKTRRDLGREKFVATVWEWKEDYHKRINNALKKLGGSFDWSREAFTLDEARSEAVTTTFVDLHEQGIIYRANRLVNWSCKLSTALSNLEVIQKELTGRTLLSLPNYDKKVEFGVLVYFKYPIEGSEETITVATTRVETMLGDTGIAVHPKDERYAHLVGKNAKHPFIEGRLLKIVADDSVEKDFGTGAVKITPAHDPQDFIRGKKHNLEFINILTDDGLMNENTGSYQGQKRFDVRYSIQEDLKKAGLYVDKKDNPMKVPICERSGDVVEPMLKPQWWMRMGELAEAAIAAVKGGKITIKPESSERSFYRWLGDINDWCLSRQLWWGHQIPVYFAKVEGTEQDRSDDSLWFSGKNEVEAEAKAKKALPGKKFTLERDEDVLDTWFSSGLWPFTTLGWPKQTDDMANFYPTTTLETGWDILFFWVARMIMLGIKLTGEVPFSEVYCHSLVRDSEGRKMSKSLGNVIDPLDVIYGTTLDKLHAKLLSGNLASTEVEKASKYQKTAFPDGIPQCGTDALRFCMVSYTTGGADINFDIKVMAAYRRFCNKIWQATKFVLGRIDKDFVPRRDRSLSGHESLAEKYILHKMNQTAKELNQFIADREFMKSTNVIYAYWYNDLCDVFIENSKAIIDNGTEQEKLSAFNTLYSALEGALLMIHPYMPFITEELWQRLPRRPDDKTPSIMLARYPVFDPALDNPAAEEAYDLVLGTSSAIRSLTSEYTIKGDAKVYIQTYDAATLKVASTEVQAIQSLSGKGVTSINILESSAPRPSGCVAFPIGSKATVFLSVKGQVDMDAEIDKATKKLTKSKGAIDKQRKILSDPMYKEKVAVATQEADRKRLADLESEARGFEGTIEQFEKLKLE